MALDQGSGVTDQTVLFVTPTHAEYASVRVAIADRLREGRIQLAICGMGFERAAAWCERLHDSVAGSTIVLLGWAGGLVPDLAAGDAVVADATLTIGGSCISLVPPYREGARVGPMLSVSQQLSTPTAKRDAARSGALAVEMEAYPLAAWAAAHDVCFIHARVILDTAGETLPDLGDALDAYGSVRPLQLARRLVAHPKTGLSLLNLARRVRQFAPTLQTLARELAARVPEAGRA